MVCNNWLFPFVTHFLDNLHFRYWVIFWTINLSCDLHLFFYLKFCFELVILWVGEFQVCRDWGETAHIRSWVFMFFEYFFGFVCIRDYVAMSSKYLRDIFDNFFNFCVVIISSFRLWPFPKNSPNNFFLLCLKSLSCISSQLQ